MGKTLKFKCTLDSDIVLSQTSCSEGNQKTLDFIPGNNFLGIAAKTLYKDGAAESLIMFHSGKVKFGDAHPSVEGVRGLKVPASMYYPKLGKASEECYIHHLTDHENAHIKAKQLKQCRDGFYSFIGNTGKPVDTQKSFTIKTAYDCKNRRSMNGQMFGYESLAKGLTLYFEVESELTEEQNDKIIKALCGKKHIGHSRSAEFGLVTIEKYEYDEIVSASPSPDNKYATVYADGRLMFLDANGEPTYLPCAEDLGFSGGCIDWSKSQIRTFQYSPWNGKRHSYDADRQGIEKGSVFIVKLEGCSSPSNSRYVGVYQTEGFGKVIYNPAFLLSSNHEQGKALFTLEEKEKAGASSEVADNPNSPLIDFLTLKQQHVSSEQTVYHAVQQEINAFGQYFDESTFASQWGSVRNIAIITPDASKLIKAIDTFISHGVAKEKWAKQVANVGGVRRTRKELLDIFMDKYRDEDLQSIIINLASEMAKKSNQ